MHTHPLGSGKGITEISPPDIVLAQYYNVIMFVYGPNGQLLKYNPVTEDVDIFEGLPKAWIKHWKYYKGEW